MPVSPVVEETDDPFEAFNRSMGAGVVTDPYPSFAEQRAVGSLIEDRLGFMAEADTEVDMPRIFQAVRYDAVQEVLRDGVRFTSSGYAAVMGQVLGHTILEMDDPEHHGYRALIQQAFTRKAMETWERDLVVPVVDELIDSFVDDGKAELVSKLFLPFPVDVIAGMLGLPRADLPTFHRLTVEVISVSIDMEIALRASRGLAEYLTPIIHQRRAEPGHDMISVLATADHEGQQLNDEEIVSFCRLLLPAGAETTYRSSSNLLCGLLTHTDQLDAVRADRSLVHDAIEEGLRWEPPLLMIMRTCSVDTEVCGVAVPEGAVMIVNLGSANHDEQRWPDPERFDIFRAPHGHVSFASGPHMCLGLHLARMETKVVLERLLDRLPNLRLDPAEPAPSITGMTFRAPYRLDVVWD